LRRAGSCAAGWRQWRQYIPLQRGIWQRADRQSNERRHPVWFRHYRERRTALAEGIHATVEKPVLHGDNGATLKATTVLAMQHWLGIKPSYSRPRISDDNPFIEAFFPTTQYRPQFPSKGFSDLDAARCGVREFVGGDRRMRWMPSRTKRHGTRLSILYRGRESGIACREGNRLQCR
jgi:transposase InsO family protein